MSEARPERALPSVERLAGAIGGSHKRAVAAAREVIGEVRNALSSGDPIPPFEEMVERGRSRLRSGLRPLINATGVLLHTNLGRAPMGEAQLDAVRSVAGGYANLEFDVEEGRRGSRHAHLSDVLRAALGCEAALVVNNNAAGVLVTLAALCHDREVIISRGELIEIGGSFRIPDVMALSGARLVEVGTTNRTRVSDYEAAIGPDTAAILKVHPSNYRMVGFSESTSVRELAELARHNDLLVINDIGSGLLDDDGLPEWVATEPTVTGARGAGADVVTFSGDKLLGGPQAGLIAGRAESLGKIAEHPLMRAVRPDKMSIAALQATVELWLAGRDGLPLWEMATVPVEELQGRAEAICDALGDVAAKIYAHPCSSLPGGGSLPDQEIPSWAVVVEPHQTTATELAAALRRNDPAVVGRIEDDRVVLDLRTVLPVDDPQIARCLSGLLAVH